VTPVILLAVFWCWESWRPFFGQTSGRWLHAVRNLAIALLNTAILGIALGFLTVFVTDWTERHQAGLLNQFDLHWAIQFALGLLLLDAWMYVWHRANHVIPVLWRFHRMHHTDPHMDVTTATRFHIGEHIAGAGLRLGVIPLLGLNIWHLVAYETLVITITIFHHANISLGKWDRWLRRAIVTPDFHKVHHSDWQAETNSNYSTVLSVWDRLAGSFRMRSDPKRIVFGLKEFAEPTWQSLWGMLKTPIASQQPAELEPDDHVRLTSATHKPTSLTAS
jgi:sterol desaturase/sphingolipid hydroxylase (fatty acid hydroxylase superfamily)